MKAADTLTIKGGPDILQEFMNVPFVNRTLGEIRKDPTYQKMQEKASKVRFTMAKETENDRQKRIATEKMSMLTEEEAKRQFKQYKRHTSTSRQAHEKPADEWKDAIYRISAIQQGFKVGPTNHLGYMEIQNTESAVINSDDIKNLGRSNVVKKVLVNGIMYESIMDKSRMFNERT